MTLNLTGRRAYWVSTAFAAAFVLYGLFFHFSQQDLLKGITSAKLASVQVYSEEKAKEESERLHIRAASMSATIAKLTATQLENSQAFRLLKDGIASTLEPFMDYSEIAAIEVTDKDNRPYASMWKGEGRNDFRVDYSMPPGFREKYKFVVRTPAIASGQTQGFVSVYIDDQAISERTAELKSGLRRVADSEIAMLSDHFRRTLLPQVLVLLCGIAFVIASSRVIARSYRLVDTHRRELAAFNLQLEHKVRERTQELEAAARENLQINRDLRASQNELLTTIAELRRKDDDLRHLAFHDALTGLPNRALLLDRMEQSIAGAARQNEKRGVMFIDIDHFKAVNDSLGHDAGDALLKEIATRLRSCLRKADTVARIGGDEFVVLLNDVSIPETYATVAQKVISKLSLPMELAGETVQVGASVGIACFPDDGKSAVELMKHADMAMYEAKSAGRGGFSFFQDSMTSASVQRLQLESELRHAISHDELELYYQPKISLGSNQLCGVEALVRWRHPVRGLMPPMEFIPLAEATGLIAPLGDWVLEEACRQSAAWKARGLGAIKIAVNISARQMQQGGLVERVCTLTRLYGISPSDLEVELTESVIMANPQESARVFASLREIGVVVAMDDFGTGYSSLAYLRRLPIDVLKIDRSFVANADQDESDAEIVKMIIALAQTLKLEVVAEGVETESQAAFLEGCGCPTVQGYLYARPQVAADFEKWLRERVPGNRVPTVRTSVQESQRALMLL
jgi:diguanylate cyclase (GGDEF)-like protein